MRMQKALITMFWCAIATMAACQEPSLGERFFAGPRENRLERFERYSLEDQFKIFRYGMDKIHPPPMVLARPIAEKGEVAVPFLLEQLQDAGDDDKAIRDIALVFERMASSKAYDVRSDPEVMNLLRSKVSAMKDREWQDTCLKMLQRIEGHSESGC